MAVGEDKTRVMVTFNKGLLQRLDAYCQSTGISRSSYISFVVSSSLHTQEQLMSGVTAGMISAMKGEERQER